MAIKMQKIPKCLLPHTVEHRHNIVVDAWGAETSHESRTIKNVCIQPTSKIVYGTDNTAIALGGVMVYGENSKPNDITFNEGEKIVFGGREYRIANIDRLYDHHFEIGLI